MATIKWVGGKSAIYLSTAAWTGGVEPGAADTAVISSSGDAAPSKSGALLTPASGSSEAYLITGPSLTLDSVSEKQETNANGVVETYFVTPSTAPTGETLFGGTLDLIAGGGETALYLQNSTLGAKTTVNVNGDAYLSAGYTNTLAGVIDIGLPFSVSGQAQAQPKADAFGYTSALYLNLEAWGSWTNADGASTYTPSVDNTGTINVGDASALVVAINAEVASIVKTGLKTETSLPPASSEFVNAGTVTIEAGGFFNGYASNESGDAALTNNATILNNGTFNVDGSGTLTTEAEFGANVSGKGLIDLQGGTDTSVAKTEAQFDAEVAGNSFDINDATLVFAPETLHTSSTGYTVSGGTITFEGKTGALQIDTPIETTVASVFGDKIDGFQAGDTITLEFNVGTRSSGAWTQDLTWNQADHTLDIYNVFGGVEQTTPEASLILNGDYTQSSFHISQQTGGGSDFATASFVITTTQTAAAVAGSSAHASETTSLAHTAAAALDAVATTSHAMSGDAFHYG